jgi:hypothetical protein
MGSIGVFNSSGEISDTESHIQPLYFISGGSVTRSKLHKQNRFSRKLIVLVQRVSPEADINCSYLNNPDYILIRMSEKTAYSGATD